MPTITTAPSVLIRAARGSDGPALARLAELDSSVVPAGELLVGESDGTIVAARSLATGDVIADPFVRTADVVALLEVRAAALHSRPRRTRGLVRRRRLAAHIA
jgi:hypothetical protein